MLERRSNNGREGSHSGSNGYATLTPSSIENRYPKLNTLSRSISTQEKESKLL